MHIKLSGALVALACVLPAQDNNPNGASIIGTPAPYPALNNLNGGTTAQVELTLMPGSTTMYYVAATVTGNVGNVGSYDVQTGTFDLSTQTFTPNNDAQGINSSGTEFQFSVTDDLLHAVVDTPSVHPVGAGNAIVISRAQITDPWVNTNAMPISGVPTGYIDPVLSKYNGQDVVLYISGTNIAMADIDFTTGVVSSIRLAAQLPTINQAIYSQLHSPGPVEDPNGDMVGMFCSGQNGGDSDLMYAPLVGYPASAPSAPGGIEVVPVWEDLGTAGNVWLANPAVLGGTVYAARSSGGYGDPYEIKTVTLAGSQVTNNMAEVNLAYPEIDPNGAALAGFLFGTPRATPITLNVLTGYLQILPVVVSPTVPALPGTTITNLTFPVPAGTPSGTLFAQAFLYDPINNTINMSNLADINN